MVKFVIGKGQRKVTTPRATDRCHEQQALFELFAGIYLSLPSVPHHCCWRCCIRLARRADAGLHPQSAR